MREWSPLERRLRRLAVLVAAFATVAAVFGMFPDGLELWNHSFKHDNDTWAGTMHAGGWALVGWAALQVLAARSVRAQPSRAAGVTWFVRCVGIWFAGGIAWLIENLRWDHQVARWPGHVTAMGVATASVLAFVVLPIVLVASRGEPPSELPQARVSASRPPRPPSASTS